MKISRELYESCKKLTRAMLDDKGHELVNPLPIEIPLGLSKPMSLQERIQRILRTELSAQAMAQGHESFEESNDFDVDDGFEVGIDQSPYTLVEEEVIQPQGEGGKGPEEEPVPEPDPQPTPDQPTDPPSG